MLPAMRSSGSTAKSRHASQSWLPTSAIESYHHAAICRIGRLPRALETETRKHDTDSSTSNAHVCSMSTQTALHSFSLSLWKMCTFQCQITSELQPGTSASLPALQDICGRTSHMVVSHSIVTGKRKRYSLIPVQHENGSLPQVSQ